MDRETGEEGLYYRFMKNIILCFLFFSAVFSVNAAQVDTVSVPSKRMDQSIKTVVITPERYDKQHKYPVVYLLHGYGADYGAWVNNAPVIKELSDAYNLIIVCPDGGKGSWYWDSPEEEDMQYETFVSQELVEWVDANYATIADRKGRAITGLSMGGHGALYLGIKHADRFGAIGSTAGGVDIRPFPLNWDMEKRLGSYAEFPQRWEEHTVMNLLSLIRPGQLKIIIDCGTGDFFYGVNQALHEKMSYLNIEHMYISQPGAHNWEYWRKSIPFQLLFMHNFFQQTAL